MKKSNRQPKFKSLFETIYIWPKIRWTKIEFFIYFQIKIE